MQERAAIFTKELQRFSDRARSNGDLEELHKFLMSLFGEPRSMRYPYSFTETGFIYQPIDELGNPTHYWRIPSRAAYRVLIQYYFDQVLSTVRMNHPDKEEGRQSSV